MITFEQFATERQLSLQHVRRIAYINNYRYIEHAGERYDLVQSGEHRNGAPKFYIVTNRYAQRPKKVHLTEDAKMAALSMLDNGKTKDEVAAYFGVEYTTIYRLEKKRNVERKRRRDAGEKRFGIPPNAYEIFARMLISHAQFNSRYAWERTIQCLDGLWFPQRYASEWGKALYPDWMQAHYYSRWARKYLPKIRIDNWATYDFMERVTWDEWTADRWVMNPHGGTDLKPRVLLVCDLKTGYPLVRHGYNRDINSEDVMRAALELQLRYGTPGGHLMDNGSVFTQPDVQRFVRGWYSTEQHDTKERVIFSEAYHPEGKGRHERLHRLLKDEWCARYDDYSPNPKDSRKPAKGLSHVGATQTIEEFMGDLNGFIDSPEFMERPRSMYRNPRLADDHPDNQQRPKTMREAFDRAYATFEPKKLDQQRLAFLYSPPKPVRLSRGLFAVKYSGYKLRYAPDNFPLNKWDETVGIIINPTNLAHAWIVDLNSESVITEAWDLVMKHNGDTRAAAAEGRKLANRIEKKVRERNKLVRELQLVNPTMAKVKGYAPAPEENVESQLYSGIEPTGSASEMSDEQLAAFLDVLEHNQ